MRLTIYPWEYFGKTKKPGYKGFRISALFSGIVFGTAKVGVKRFIWCQVQIKVRILFGYRLKCSMELIGYSGQ